MSRFIGVKLPNEARKNGARRCTAGWLIGLFALCGLLTTRAVAQSSADKQTCLGAHEQAQILRMHGRYTDARTQLLMCAQSGCPKLITSDCSTWLSEVEASLPSLVFAVSDAQGGDLTQVRVFANGKLVAERTDGRAVTLDPGAYRLRFEAPGHAHAEQDLTVREAEKHRLVRAQLAPSSAQSDPRDANPYLRAADGGVAAPARHRSAPVAAYVLAGTALASAGAGIFFAVRGKRELKRVERSECAPNCPDSETRDGERDWIVADVAFGAAVGLGVAATWVYVASRRKARAQSARAQSPVLVSISRGALLVGLRGEL